MKKRILALTLILAFCMAFVGCGKKEEFDIDGCIKELEAQGLTVKEHLVEGDALALQDAKLNLDISRFAGNFSVDLKSYTLLFKDDPDVSNCKIIKFASSEQASMYGGFFMNNRGDTGSWRVAIIEDIVIVTNISAVEQTVNAVFK